MLRGVYTAPMLNRAAEARRAREETTAAIMIGLYCRRRHGTRASVCRECAELTDFMRARLARCPHIEAKPTCAECRTHCYAGAPSMQAEIRKVMRCAGPLMLLRHPWLSLLHYIDTMRSRAAVRRRDGCEEGL